MEMEIKGNRFRFAIGMGFDGDGDLRGSQLDAVIEYDADMSGVPSLEDGVKSSSAHELKSGGTAEIERWGGRAGKIGRFVLWLDQFSESGVVMSGQCEQNLVGKTLNDYCLGLDFSSAIGGERIPGFVAIGPGGTGGEHHHEEDKCNKTSVNHHQNHYLWSVLEDEKLF